MEDAIEWIRQEILDHMERHRIMAYPETVDKMAAAAAKGCYAFNIVYMDIGRDPDYESILSTFSELDHSQIRVRVATADTDLAFSYDGGKRFQWFDKETIYIDPAKVRDIKISQIIKDK
jgi:hypothetical protein